MVDYVAKIVIVMLFTYMSNFIQLASKNIIYIHIMKLICILSFARLISMVEQNMFSDWMVSNPMNEPYPDKNDFGTFLGLAITNSF